MNSPFLARLNSHFFEVIACHPLVRDNDFRQSSLLSFNEALNKFKPENEGEKAIANFFRDACNINLRSTVEYLKRLNLLGLTQFINGHCMAIALGIDNKLYISTDPNGIYNASLRLGGGESARGRRGSPRGERKSGRGGRGRGGESGRERKPRGGDARNDKRDGIALDLLIGPKGKIAWGDSPPEEENMFSLLSTGAPKVPTLPAKTETETPASPTPKEASEATPKEATVEA